MASSAAREAPTLDAATVVLARPGRGVTEALEGGFEVYMTLRPEEMESYAGYYVFPGGKVSVEDRAPESILACADATAVRAPQLIDEEGVPGRALAHWVAAIRETFEEVGVLYCDRTDGEPLNWADPKLAARVAEYRDKLQRRAIRLHDMLRAESWCLRTSALWYLCRWITPSLNPRRFDAKFFLAVLPPGQQPGGGGREVDAGLWLPPAAVIAGYEQGRLKLRTPTIITLRYLAQFPTHEELVKHHQDGEPKFHAIPI
jgi:8-oxo-dGTP pyrophosphatase MutT (NUDIX family)